MAKLPITKPISQETGSEINSPFSILEPGIPKVTGTETGPEISSPGLEVTKDLIVGTVKWSRQLGLPDGPLTEAFQITCYTYSLERTDELGTPLGEQPRHPHIASIVEGPHDDLSFRITYYGQATTPAGWPKDATNAEAIFNYVEFAIVAPWPNTTASGPGQKWFIPDETIRFVHPMTGPYSPMDVAIWHLRR